MLFHKIDPITKIYIESVEAEVQPEHSTDKDLPEITEHYTVAFIDGEFVSVLKPDLQIIDNEIKKIQTEEIPQ
jgi:hypothetical protein